VKRFRGGLVFKAHRLLYHSTLSLRVIKKKKRASYLDELEVVAGFEQRRERGELLLLRYYSQA